MKTRRLKQNGKVLAMLLRKSRGNYLQLWLQICRKSTCLWTNTKRKISLGVEWKVLFPIVTSFGINKNWFLKVNLAMNWAFFQGIVWSLQQWGWQFWHVLGKWRPLPCLWCPQVGSTPVQHQTVPVCPGTPGCPRWVSKARICWEGGLQSPFGFLFAFSSTFLKAQTQCPCLVTKATKWLHVYLRPAQSLRFHSRNYSWDDTKIFPSLAWSRQVLSSSISFSFSELLRAESLGRSCP